MVDVLFGCLGGAAISMLVAYILDWHLECGGKITAHAWTYGLIGGVVGMLFAILFS